MQQISNGFSFQCGNLDTGHSVSEEERSQDCKRRREEKAKQGQDGWGLTYTSTEICAVKGSTVEIRCSYKYPSPWRGSVNKVQKTFWFTKLKGGVRVDLTTDSEYAGRVEDLGENNICTLRIKNLRESDSAEYKFRFETNQGGKYGGSPGVTLSVSNAPKLPSVSVRPSAEIKEGSSVTLTCSSDANPAANYTWYKKDGSADLSFVNEGPLLLFSSIQSSDSGQYYYSPKLPSVSVSPSAEIEEGSSVTLTCSSGANPAANYTWYKTDQNAHLSSVNEGLVLSSINSSDSGQYYCTAENKLGRKTSKNISIDVKYAPKLPSVSVSPSAEIEEGSSVTLTCSSDANPAANYTWYKKNADSPKASGQIFTITDFRAEHSGSYSCGAQNKLGRSNSTLYLIVVAGSWKIPAAVTIAVVLLAVISLSVFLWIRRKRASRDSSEPEERADTREECVPDQPEQQDDLQYASVHFSNNRAEPLYSNMRAAEPLRHTEQQEVSEYAAVKFSSAAPRTRGQDSEEDPAALYSTVNKYR
ncbi:hypothetical protein NQZ68_013470 [Dissostichus eleginoides]|nr:hypothetical protein NQZ68_013470 [Dissostichus eleginoides]